MSNNTDTKQLDKEKNFEWANNLNNAKLQARREGIKNSINKSNRISDIDLSYLRGQSERLKRGGSAISRQITQVGEVNEENSEQITRNYELALRKQIDIDKAKREALKTVGNVAQTNDQKTKAKKEEEKKKKEIISKLAPYMPYALMILFLLILTLFTVIAIAAIFEL